MGRIHIHLIKWISNKLGYKIILLKGGKGKLIVEGNKEVYPYVDISGYFFKKEPLKRVY